MFQAVREKFMKTRGDREAEGMVRLVFQIENLLI